ncbi:helix-turn-helix domain-containing protein [Poritiphilus flavus]|uniref:Helix-turn-helix domain-containing protein n=1 Tax=Poritiphilus flavus TaxID=2697053 RepID=A0A6L9EFY2_9FLAO|nr:helix-turn-helix domain-containing protein [Poritiphilus flavus]NAS13664.1 helix-turn-helix domain-containing protein [Poritiphilus flavus]
MELSIARDITLLINAVGVGNCFLLSYLYVRQPRQTLNNATELLSLLFFIIGSVILNTIFNFTGYSELFYGFESISNALSFAIAPILYLYIRSFNYTNEEQDLRSPHLWHFYAYLCLVSLQLILPESLIGHWAKSIMDSLAMIVVWNVHFLVYTVLVAREFQKKHTQDLGIQKLIAGGIISIWAANLILFLYRIFVAPLSIFVYLNITLLFSGLTFWLLFRKFKDNSLKPGKARRKKVASNVLPLLDEEKLVRNIIDQKYYRDPELNIRKLAGLLELPYTSLSELINRRYSKNFNEFINGFRVQEVVDALESDSHHSFTIMGLAERAGFRSASSFYAAFKKAKGTTPTLYLEQLA